MHETTNQQTSDHNNISLLAVWHLKTQNVLNCHIKLHVLQAGIFQFVRFSGLSLYCFHGIICIALFSVQVSYYWWCPSTNHLLYTISQIILSGYILLSRSRNYNTTSIDMCSLLSRSTHLDHFPTIQFLITLL